MQLAGMTARQLIEQLQQVPGDTLIVLSQDSEGNGYAPLHTIDTHNSAYTPEASYRGEVQLRMLTPELAEQGFSEEDVADPETSVPCVCLWPM